MRRLFVLLAIALLTAPALAHGLLMKLSPEGGAVAGQLYYSNGTRAAGEWIEVTDLDEPAAQARTLQADGEGLFSFEGVRGHRYRVVALGEEGHTIEMEVTLAPGERAQLAEASGHEASDDGYPAWAIIGGILALSGIPALVLRRRNQPASREAD
jgi:hypothetical protein